MNKDTGTGMHRQAGMGAGKGLAIGTLLAALALVALAGTLVYLAFFQGSHGGASSAPLEQPPSFQAVDEEGSPLAHHYQIRLDTSAYEGAVLAENTVLVELGKPVEALPYATLEGMRFVGWFTGPADDAGATKIDNNSLGLLALDTDRTLYARFEPRPTSLDTANPGLPILMYHYFYDPNLGEAGEDANWMDIHLFESHLAYLESNHYYFPTWEEVGAYIRGEILLPERSIVLCSDDGHESFFRLAAPLVLAHGAKMTSFIPLIDLPPGRLTEYDPERIFVQSHSYDMHRGGIDGDARILTSTYQEIYDDARMAQQLLGNMLVLCYPYGKTNSNAMEALRDAGVGVALLIENDRAYPLCDPMAVPRLRMSDGSTAEYLAQVAY